MSIQLEEVNSSIASVFERQSDRFSRQVAIDTPAHGLTFEQVDAAANRVALELLARRGDSSEPVPLVVAEPALMLIALLGVLKSGKFYIPVNPFFPAARVQLLLANMHAAIVLCDDVGHRALGTAGVRERRVRLEELMYGSRAENRPGIPADADRFAYVLYTSGSTGSPKGVAQTHRNALHNVYRHGVMGIGPDDRVAHLSADGFMGSVSNPYIAFLNGASVVTYSFQQGGVHGMLDWLAEKRVTVYYSFPSFFRQIVAAASAPARTRELRLLYLGGEQVYPSDVAAVRRLFPATTVLVGLNSTETGLTRLQVIPPEADEPEDVVPVGRPVPGVEVRIIDDAGRRLEDGRAGEIVVLSPYIFPWYWQPESSGEDAAKITRTTGPHPFRTGDRGFINAKGELVHLGRLDSMVKVRGYRVELSEVELRLSAIPAVVEAAVIAHTLAPGETELVAYVVVREPCPTSRELRLLLGEMLPEAMLPSVFVFLEALPRTENGKINRQALPFPPGSRQADMRQHVLPRDPIEEGVVRILGSVLSTTGVGVTDNFFELGGHSIMAVRVISAIRKEFGVPVPLRVLFDTPSVEALAREVVRLQAATQLARRPGHEPR